MKRHDPDYFSFAAGLLFTVLGVVLTVSAATNETIDGRWLMPIILTVLGAGGVAAALAATRRQRVASAVSDATDEMAGDLGS